MTTVNDGHLPVATVRFYLSCILVSVQAVSWFLCKTVDNRSLRISECLQFIFIVVTIF